MLAHTPARADTKRPEIERAALELFVTRGLKGTTIREIATRAGVAEGTLYRHWRSKRELARFVFQGCAARVAGELRQAAAGEADPSAKLTAAVRALFRCAREGILLYEVLLVPPGRDIEDFVEMASSPATVLAELFANLTPELDPRLAAECVIGAVNRVAAYRRLGALPRRLSEYEHDIAAMVAKITSTEPVRSSA